MAKTRTFPECLDELKMVTICWLRQLGHLRPNHASQDTLSWTRAGRHSGSITVVTDADNKFVELSYSINRRPISYRVNLESVPSNLGKGEVWYFRCPATGKRCRTLYEYGDYFYSRHVFHKPLYSSQIVSKSFRGLLQVIRSLRRHDQFLAKRYARTHYHGKITRRYQRLLNRASRVYPDQIEEMFRMLLKGT